MVFTNLVEVVLLKYTREKWFLSIFKVLAHANPLSTYFCKSDYFTLYKQVYTKKTCFLSFSQIFSQKRGNSPQKEKQMPGG